MLPGLILALKLGLNSTVLEALERRRASSVNPVSLLPLCFLQIALENETLPSPAPLFSQVTQRALSSHPRPGPLEVSFGVIPSPLSTLLSGIAGRGAAEPCRPAPSPGAPPACPSSPDAVAHCQPSWGHRAVPALLSAPSRRLHN